MNDRTRAALAAPLALAALAAPLAAPAAQAEPLTNSHKAAAGCVTQGEYDAVEGGWTKHRVQERFDTTGYVIEESGSGGHVYVLSKGYTACPSMYQDGETYIEVVVTYRRHKDGTGKYRVAAKGVFGRH